MMPETLKTKRIKRCLRCNKVILGGKSGMCNSCVRIGRRASEETKRKQSEAMKGRSNFWLKGKMPWNWKGGRMTKDGIRIKKEGLLLHRIKMEEFLGRKLKTKETIHHCDKNKANNDMSNLQYFRSHSAHKRLHHFAKRHGIDMTLLRFEQPWLETAK